MKKFTKFGMVLVASMLAMQLNATYYVVGNGTDDPNGKWCNGKNWVVDAAENALDENGSITFFGVAAGKNYGFKITNGAWGGVNEVSSVDFDNSDEPMYGGNGNDIGFTLSEEADVTITLVDGLVRLHATKPLAYRSNYYYITGNGKNRDVWCGGNDWSVKATALTEDKITFENLPAEWYEFKVTNGTWDRQWSYSSLDIEASSPMHKTYGDGGNICFRLQNTADVTIKIVRNKVVLLIDREYCITGNGEEIEGAVWLAGHQWYGKDDDMTLDENLSRTFNNLPAGTYKFKIKENADGWHDDCTFGWDKFDSENSISCVADGSNISFTLEKAKNVTIAIVENKVRVTAEDVTPTGIDAIDAKRDGKYYDVLGRQVANPQRGSLYIRNGEKLIY